MPNEEARARIMQIHSRKMNVRCVKSRARRCDLRGSRAVPVLFVLSLPGLPLSLHLPFTQHCPRSGLPFSQVPDLTQNLTGARDP